jgi:hypothetical protein
MKNKKLLNSHEQLINKLDYITEDLTDTYVYIKSLASFYWLEQDRLYKPRDIANNLMCSEFDLKNLRRY